MIRVLIVDDELPARERLRRLLGGIEEVEIAGEAVDGVAAIEQIRRLRPDVVLLDIERPGCRGTEVAASLPGPRPHIIFCTAYDQFAVEAFELRAVDYLLKPVSRARLAGALQRVRQPGATQGQAGAAATLPGPLWRALRGGSHGLHYGISVRRRTDETMYARPRILDGPDAE
jgi:two-component system LytT family response regulator